MADQGERDVQAEIDAYLAAATAGLAREQAVYLLAVLANRSAAELQRLARAGAAERKGAAEWGRWASLQNAARSLVLQSSTARDISAQLAGRRR